MKLPTICIILTLCGTPGLSQIESTQPDSLLQRTLAESLSTHRLSLFYNIGGNIRESFLSEKFLFHATAVGSTYLLVNSNADYHVHNYFSEGRTIGYFFSPAIVTGAIIPVAVALPLYLDGKCSDNREKLGAAYAVVQSSLVILVYTSTVKAFTGRPRPTDDPLIDQEALSREFNFGFWRGGIIRGLPSGHTAATMAVVSTLSSYYPERTWIKIGGYAFIFYTAIGVAAVKEGTMHWLSDGVAGALMGFSIGSTVGENFRQAFRKHVPESEKHSLRFVPTVSSTAVNVTVVLSF